MRNVQSVYVTMCEQQLEEETNERIKEEKAQAAKARALTDALMQGLEIVNRNIYASPVSS